MRKHYQKVLKTFFHERLTATRHSLGISQERMSERLVMAERTYIDLDHGKTGCSAVTLALFLIYVCSDPAVFLEELRNAFETDESQAA